MSEKKPLQKILILALVSAFLGSTGIMAVGLFSDALQQPEESATSEAELIIKELQEQEKGYEKVLEREPENLFALQRLVQIRLQMNNLTGAIQPLEKLIELNPEQSEYKELLDRLKQQVGEVDKGDEEHKEANTN
ncbi:MAG: tetratricopeptide repeat protein [Symploca sp. SIO3C6]|nr:tetratricopeptide repeat protein [Symploca sp. SIO3C6]NET04571.1 tetratricopeptide repeat protein [Symploca sp. SIO2B6]NET53593.1 tetratricopeptide repeat protein [Merismopedia sp. SIO2A8]